MRPPDPVLCECACVRKRGVGSVSSAPRAGPHPAGSTQADRQNEKTDICAAPAFSTASTPSRRLSSGRPYFSWTTTLPLARPCSRYAERLLGLLERKNLVNHRPNALRLEKLADLRELIARLGARTGTNRRLREPWHHELSSGSVSRTARHQKFMPRERARTRHPAVR